MAKRLGLVVAIVLSVGVACGLPSARAQMPPREQVTIRELPPVSAHWVAVMSPFAGSITVTPVVLVDGDSLQVIGMLSGGIAGMFAAAPDHKQFYMADTFYSRGTRGERTDVVTIYDARKLAPVGEIVIPPKRQLSIQDPTSMGVTTDGRFLLVANLTPATSVTVVDLQGRKVTGEIGIPGCAEILALGAREFTSVCGDGSMLTTQFDDNARATAQKRTAKPFFDVEKDPVFAQPAMFGKQADFVSYSGIVYPMDLGSSPARPGESWPLLSASEKKADWRPGGWQPVSGYAPGHLLFVLMHQGGEVTHQDAGPEVWVYDVRQHKRVDRIPLPQKANSIMVSRDGKPLLFAAATQPGMLEAFSALDGKYLGVVKNVTQNPYSLFGL